MPKDFEFLADSRLPGSGAYACSRPRARRAGELVVRPNPRVPEEGAAWPGLPLSPEGGLLARAVSALSRMRERFEFVAPDED